MGSVPRGGDGGGSIYRGVGAIASQLVSVSGSSAEGIQFSDINPV